MEMETRMDQGSLEREGEEEGEEQINLLHLPDEILLEILAFLPGFPGSGVVVAVLAFGRDRAVDGHRFWPRPFNAIGQGPGDLGERMNRVFQDLPPGPVVLVGTDVPGIRAAHITDAFRALGNNDAVFGPARDGGYWLVGARRRPVVPDLFGGITWSTPRTLKDTLTKLNGKKVALLDPLDDIDDGAAYEKLITGAL